MTERFQVFRCEKCGHMTQILRAGGGTLTCCGVPMQALAENTVDASKEKHVPVVRQEQNGLRVTVGSTAHPMEDKHFIEWIEVRGGGELRRHHLRPGEAPEAFFADWKAESPVIVREFCNLHGLWKT